MTGYHPRERKPSMDKSSAHGGGSTSSASASSSGNKGKGQAKGVNANGGSSSSSISHGSNNNNNHNNNNNNTNPNNHHQQRNRSDSHSSSHGHHHHHHQRRSRSDSHSSSHGHGPRKPQSKKDLWKDALEVEIGGSTSTSSSAATVVVQMVGMDSPSHTVYARVDPSSRTSTTANSNSNSSATTVTVTVTVGKVVEAMVTEGWRSAAKSILTTGAHVETEGTYPSAAELLHLGSVWLLNETDWATGGNAHARRLAPADEGSTPEWEDMTLRVHYVPDRFFAAHEVDWGRYCRGLLLDGGCTSAMVGGRRMRVPVSGMPNAKDGVIVYEDNDIGFAVLNKPGGMPIHHTLSNNAEDVSSMFSAALGERSKDDSRTHPFLSMPLRVEPEMHGLLLAATKKEFCSYMTKQLDAAAKADDDGAASATAAPGDAAAADAPSLAGVAKTYRCLVCVRDPDDIDRIESMVGRTIEHHVDVRSPTPKKFVRNRPAKSSHEWARCGMVIVSAAGKSDRHAYRAACVSSAYSDSNDYTLAHRLWGPNFDHPAEHLGVRYVMELEVRLLGARARPHQIRGQLAALGVPIVGDAAYGGGTCEMRMHHHMWTRMAVQICRLEFALPARREEEDEGADAAAAGQGEGEEKKAGGALVPSEERCVFHLNTAWWSEYLVDYERYFVAAAASAAAEAAPVAAPVGVQ